MNSVALCAGVGMLDEGCAAAFEYLGIAHTVAAYVEREAFAAAQLVALMEAGVLAPALVWSDLTTFDARPWRGKVDCITGGFPCQPHSVAGKREGVEDERWIWDDIERIIRDTGAWCVVFENVRGLLSSGGMGPVLASLSRLGFTVEWTVISAGEVGASHRRERVIIVAYAEHDARSAQWRAGQGRRGNKSPHHAAGAGRPGEIVLADDERSGCQNFTRLAPQGWEPNACHGGRSLLADGDGGRHEQQVRNLGEGGGRPANGSERLADAERGEFLKAPAAGPGLARGVAADRAGRAVADTGRTPVGCEIDGDEVLRSDAERSTGRIGGPGWAVANASNKRRERGAAGNNRAADRHGPGLKFNGQPMADAGDASAARLGEHSGSMAGAAPRLRRGTCECGCGLADTECPRSQGPGPAITPGGG